ncbi:MAG: hypothetical protein OEU35_10560 [Desulfuromonadales bacterium]|nr:hypothetical protein [Desulfuromonadales bacterium]
MAESLQPGAENHLPMFITAPGETDVLFILMAVFVLGAVISLGVIYFRLHALPEQVAHRGQKVQFELVAVLALLALFTHNHSFWIAGLLLALTPLPDVKTPVSAIVGSLDRIAKNTEPEGSSPPPARDKLSLDDDQPIPHEGD